MAGQFLVRRSRNAWPTRLPLLLASAACRTVAPQPPSPESSACAADHEWTEAFATSIRAVFDSSTSPRPEEIVPIYDSSVCARAIRAFLEEDAPSDSLRELSLTARVLSIGNTEWAAIILPDECTYHWFNRAWHHVGVHLWACL